MLVSGTSRTSRSVASIVFLVLLNSKSFMNCCFTFNYEVVCRLHTSAYFMTVYDLCSVTKQQELHELPFYL